MWRRNVAAVVAAAVLVPVALFLVVWAFFSQISWFGEEPTHQGRAVLMLVMAVGLLLLSFAALTGAAVEPRRRLGVVARPGLRLRRLLEAAGAAVVAGVVSAAFTPLWNNLFYPLAFAAAVGAAFALPRRTTALLVARVGAAFAVITLVSWAEERTHSAAFLGFVLALPAVVAADLLVSWWRRPRFVALAVACALLPAGLVVWVHRVQAREAERAAAYRRAHPIPPAASVGHERVLWQTQFSASGAAISSPVVAGRLVIFASGDGRIHALDLHDGSRVWSTPGFVTPPAELVAVDNTVLVPGLQLEARDARTGELIWRHRWARGGTRAAVLRGRVVVAAGERGPLVGLRFDDGKQLWKVATPWPEPAPRFTPPTGGIIAIDGLAVAWTDILNPRDGALVFAIDDSGAVIWTRRFSDKPVGLAAVDGKIFGCARYGRFSLDPRTGRLHKRTIGRCNTSEERGVASSGVAYIPWTSTSGERVTGGVRAVDEATGKALWRFAVDGGVPVRPAVTTRAVVVAGGVDCRVVPCSASIYAVRR